MPYDMMPSIDPSWNTETDAIARQSSAGSLEAGDGGGIKVDAEPDGSAKAE